MMNAETKQNMADHLTKKMVVDSTKFIKSWIKRQI